METEKRMTELEKLRRQNQNLRKALDEKSEMVETLQDRVNKLLKQRQPEPELFADGDFRNIFKKRL